VQAIAKERVSLVEKIVLTRVPKTKMTSPTLSLLEMRESHVYTDFPNRPLLPDQEKLVREALETACFLTGKGIDLFHVVLAQRTRDSEGLPWNAYVYSSASDGTDLRLVGHSESKGSSYPVPPFPEGSRLIFSRQGQTPFDPSSVRSFVSEPPPDLEASVYARLHSFSSERGFPKRSVVSSCLASFEELSCEHHLPTFRIGDLLNHSLLPNAKKGSSPSVKIIQGVDAFLFGMGKQEFTRNSIFQVASQFNFLESTGPYHMKLQDYHSDMTQGPQASLGCPGMLAYRNAVLKGASDASLQPFFRDFPGVYSKGYFTPGRLSRKDLTSLLSHVSSNWRDIRMLAQAGKSLYGDHKIMQVFSAAPCFQENLCAPSISDPEGRICEIVVGRQYQALGALAALHSKSTGARVNLHLTLVGQGAFQNPPQVMETALALLLESVGESDVDVYIHAWSLADTQKVLAALSNIFPVAGDRNFEIVRSDDFFG